MKGGRDMRAGARAAAIKSVPAPPPCSESPPGLSFSAVTKRILGARPRLAPPPAPRPGTGACVQTKRRLWLTWRLCYRGKLCFVHVQPSSGPAGTAGKVGGAPHDSCPCQTQRRPIAGLSLPIRAGVQLGHSAGPPPRRAREQPLGCPGPETGSILEPER